MVSIEKFIILTKVPEAKVAEAERFRQTSAGIGSSYYQGLKTSPPVTSTKST